MGCCRSQNQRQESITQVKFEKELDINYGNKWHRGVLRETMNGKYRHQFKILNKPNSVEIWSNLDERYNDSQLKMNTNYWCASDDNDYVGIAQMVEFDPLHTHTKRGHAEEQYLKFECPFSIETGAKLLYYHSNIRGIGYIIVLNTRFIHEYDTMNQQWCRTFEIALYINDLSTFCPYVDASQHKLYLFGSGQSAFCIFDLECFKFNFVKHNESFTFSGFGINIDDYYKRHHVKCLFTTFNKNDAEDALDEMLFGGVDDYNTNDGVKWHDDDAPHEWRRGIVIQQTIAEVTLCTKHNPLEVRLETMNADLFSLKTKYDDFDFEFDENLNHLLQGTTFYIGTNQEITERNNYARNTNVITFHRKAGYVQGTRIIHCDRPHAVRYEKEKLEMIYVEDMQRVYIFGQIAQGIYGQCVVTVHYIDILRNDAPIPLEYVDCYWVDCIVPIRIHMNHVMDAKKYEDRSYILLLRWGDLESYCMNLVDETTFGLRVKFHGFTNVISAVYDDLYHNIYFISSDGYHKIMNVMEILPMEMFAEFLVTGFISIAIEPLGYEIPAVLYDIILKYFPIDC